MPADLNDRTDFEEADRGLIGSLVPCIVKDDEGRVVWDNDAYAFLDGDAPDTVNPSLWRISQLCAKQGLYEVADGIYQVRGLDLSNMTLVEGDEGVIVIDPLISKEVAAAAIRLYRTHRGDRPVSAVIYTHSHIDHFGGVEGVTDGSVPIVAPDGFLEHSVVENIYAGTAMLRRSVFMYGALLERGPEGQVGAGLGMTNSVGTATLLAPTLDITHTGQEETIDGVRIVFQSTPNTEAPSEMNFLFPDRRALCMAENATHNLHNILTLRGAVVRDARMWGRYLNEAIELFAHDADVAFASHHWPTFGTERIVRFLSEQRDLYTFLHDQTLRLTNRGYTGTEIAEMIEMPPALDAQWHTHGYYGSVSHNVKAIYQRYMGWFDGNPAHLWELPPEESSARYVECMGGGEAVVARARGYASSGDLRFAAQLLNHAVFADPGDDDAKAVLADVYRQLGFGCENGTWRNFYLTGARELSEGISDAEYTNAAGLASALTVTQVFDSIAVRIDGRKAWNESLTIDWSFTDLNERYRMVLSNGALSHWPDPKGAGTADLTVTLTKPGLLGLVAGEGTEGIEMEGDAGRLEKLISLTDQPDPRFNIVVP